MNVRETFVTVKNHELRFVQDAKNLQYLSGKKVTVYQVTPLEKISFDDASLEKYSSLLTKKLSSPGLSVELEEYDGLPTSLSSLLLTVRHGQKTVHQSLFLTVSEGTGEKRCRLRLPLMVTLKARQREVGKLHQAVQQLFKCRIRAVQLTDQRIFWLMGISICETIKRNINAGINLSLVLPSLAQATLNILYDEKSLALIWGKWIGTKSEVIGRNELDIFFSELIEHGKMTYGIDLSVFSIRAFDVLGVHLTFRPTMKISRPEVMFSLLSYLISDCIL